MKDLAYQQKVLTERKKAIEKEMLRKNPELQRLLLQKKSIKEMIDYVKVELSQLSEELNDVYIELDSIETEILIKENL
jgi:seryl-tRNA synthetase